jgi:hypothetical protein
MVLTRHRARLRCARLAPRHHRIPAGGLPACGAYYTPSAGAGDPSPHQGTCGVGHWPRPHDRRRPGRRTPCRRRRMIRSQRAATGPGGRCGVVRQCPILLKPAPPPTRRHAVPGRSTRTGGTLRTRRRGGDASRVPGPARAGIVGHALPATQDEERMLGRWGERRRRGGGGATERVVRGRDHRPCAACATCPPAPSGPRAAAGDMRTSVAAVGMAPARHRSARHAGVPRGWQGGITACARALLQWGVRQQRRGVLRTHRPTSSTCRPTPDTAHPVRCPTIRRRPDGPGVWGKRPYGHMHQRLVKNGKVDGIRVIRS